METVFSHIVQKRYPKSYEDIATDALAYILASSDGARRGFMKLLRGIERDLPDLEFRTQKAEDELRPDMWGFDGSDPRVFVENKFWAGFTVNQPVAYLKRLQRCTQPAPLLIIVPGAREQTVVREVDARASAAGVVPVPRECPPGLVFVADSGLGPMLAVTSWPRVLKALEAEVLDDAEALANLMQLRSLCDAADSEAFTPLAADDISDQRIPALLQQLYAVVEASVDLAVNQEILDLRRLKWSTSGGRIGRYVRFTGPAEIGCWMGIEPVLWRKYGRTPLWLDFSTTNFGRAQEVSEAMNDAASGTVNVRLPNGRYIVGLNVPPAVGKDAVVRAIVADLETVRKSLMDIPPAADAADAEMEDESE